MTGTSLLATMANRYEMDPVTFARTLRATAMPSKHTEEQFAAFMMVAHQYGLNPLTREIFAFENKKSGGVVPVVSVDGWVHLVNDHPAMDGFEIHYEHDDDGKLVSATCAIWRKDRSHPVVVTEYLDEVYRNTDPWNGMPRRMLRHKALKECARYAFGFSGLTDEDEARDITQAVAEIEHEIVDTSQNALDAFAAGEVDTTEVAAAPSAGSDQTAASDPTNPSSPSEAAVDPSDDDSHVPIAIVSELLGNASGEGSKQDRLERLEVAVADLVDNYPEQESFIRNAAATAVKVAKAELKADAARKYLLG
jgi:phage recombination protein Bet